MNMPSAGPAFCRLRPEPTVAVKPMALSLPSKPPFFFLTVSVAAVGVGAPTPPMTTADVASLFGTAPGGSNGLLASGPLAESSCTILAGTPPARDSNEMSVIRNTGGASEQRGWGGAPHIRPGRSLKTIPRTKTPTQVSRHLFVRNHPACSVLIWSNSTVARGSLQLVPLISPVLLKLSRGST